MESQDAKPATPETPMTEPVQLDENKDARMWGMLCHISALAGFVLPFGNLIGPLVLWQIKKNEFPFADDQGKESLNFQILVSIALLVTVVLGVVTCGIGFILTPLVLIVGVVFAILGGVKANTGVKYRYPFNWRMIK